MTGILPLTELARALSKLTRGEIGALASFVPEPLLDLGALPLESAIFQLERAHAALFVPTEQLLDTLETMVGMACAHACGVYDDVRSYSDGCQSRRAPLPGAGVLLFVTGLAGVGKSSILSAFKRVLLSAIPLRAYDIPELGHFSLVPVWAYEISGRRSVNAVFKGLHERAVELDYLARGMNGSSELPVGTPKLLEEVVAACRKRAYRDGVLMLLADEFQFLTRSANANTLVTDVILSLRRLGLPCICAANYSLGHRLLQRNHEDQDRLFERPPIVIMPEQPDSEDWQRTVRSYVAISPEIMDIDPVLHAARIHGLCVTRRYLGRLLRLSYKIARKANRRVTIDTIQEAFGSRDFERPRKEIEEIRRISSGISSKSLDLICPFELPKNVVTQERERVMQQRTEAVMATLSAQQMTRTEHEVLRELRAAAANPVRGGSSGKVRSLNERPGLSVAALREAEDERRSRLDRS